MSMIPQQVPSAELAVKLEQMLNRMDAPDVIAKACDMTQEAVETLIRQRPLRPFYMWWSLLVEGRRKVLLDDRWQMAEAAFNGGRDSLAREIHAAK